MKFSKIDLLTLLISLFLFSGCKKSINIGLEIDPQNAIQGIFTDSLSIRSSTIPDDITSTANLSRSPLGYMEDPIFGTTEASLALTVGLPSSLAYNFGDLPELDSAVLILPYSSEFYGDSTKNYTFDVYQLRENLTNLEAFPSNRQYTHESFIVGNRSGRLFPNTRLKVLDPVSGGKDTIANVAPQIRIRLDNEFATAYIVKASEFVLKNDPTFIDRFKGLYVQMSKGSSGEKGAMTFIDMSSANAGIAMYYKNTGTTNPRDTITALFPIGTANTPVAATVKHNYAGTPIDAQLKNPNQQFQVTYLQPLAGLRNKISFPYLDSFRKKAGKIVVNKAELVIDIEPGTDLTPFEAAPRLALYRYDIAEQRANLPDNSDPAFEPRALGAAVFGGFYNAVKKQYVFVITSYIQDLISGKIKDYGTFLAPIPNDQAIVTPSMLSAARAVIGSYKKNAQAGESKMKLNLYYTKVD